MNISLREYNHLIEDLIDQGNASNAVDHCRHILLDFPRHLETNRLLGKAYIDLKDFSSAYSIFELILNSVPDDFVANVGNSLIFDEQGDFENAIWHMERAFETQPSNAAVQSELANLYGRRDGMRPPRIRMTRGALAHLYGQGELYVQSISECKAILKDSPNRYDIKVLIARAYYFSKEFSEAYNVCKELLQIEPYCFDANRIMFEMIDQENVLREEPESYFGRITSLDPYAKFFQKSVFKTYEVHDSAVLISKLEKKYSEVVNKHNLPTRISSEVSIPNREQAEILNLEGVLRVFLCHSSHDKEKVRQLYKRLKSEISLKIDPWLDEEKLIPGDEWDLEIRKAVRAAHLVIVCLSQKSITKEGYVQKEIQDALDIAQEKPPGTVYIIPVKFEECDVPERLKRYHWLNAYEENSYEKLLLSLRKRAKDFGIY